MTETKINVFVLLVLMCFSVANLQDCICSNDQHKNLNCDACKSSSEATLTYLNEQFEKFKFAKQKDTILVVGNTGSAQTMLSLLVTEAEINGVEISPGEFTFVDKYGLIEEDSASVIPRLIDDPKTGLEFYICALNNVTAFKYDIATLFFLRRVLKFSERIKLILTADHSLFINFQTHEERHKLREFIINVTTLIKNVEKSIDIISLVVTNIESNDNDGYVLIDITHALAFVMSDFDGYSNEANLTWILTEQSNYPRIGLLRRATQSGAVSEMTLLQQERKRISVIIHDIIKYTKVNESDFGYPILDSSKERIPELIETLQTRLIGDTIDIGNEIKAYFMQLERGTDLNILYDQISLGHQHISEVSSAELHLFAKELIDAINILGVEIQTDKIKPLLDHIELAELLDAVINSSSLYTTNGLRDIKNYLNESKIWYEFTIDLHDILSKYSVQQNTTQYQFDVLKLLVQLSINENEEINIDDTDLKEFLDRISSDIYSRVQNMTVNSYKLNALKTILSYTLNSIFVSTCSPTKLEVKGYIVKISDVIKVECSHEVNIVNVFALSKVFIDADIGGKEFTIIAPTWDFDLRFASSYHQSLLEMPESNIKDSCEGVIKYIKSSYSFNAYKDFVRENLANYIWETVLREFLNTLTENECIKPLYDTAGFINELLSMENQYFRLRNELSFVSFFESLQKRVTEYTKINTKDKKTLLLLCTAILSKLAAIKNHGQGVSLIGIYDHFKLLKEKVNRLRRIESETNIFYYQTEYKISLGNKIKSTMDFVLVNLKIQKANFEVKTKIPKLIDEVIDQPNDNVQKNYEFVQKQIKLENFVRLHQMLNTASVVNVICEFFGSVATNILDIWEGDILMVEPFVKFNKSSIQNQLNELVISLNVAILEMQKTLKKEHMLFFEQLKDIKAEANEECDKREVIKDKVDELIDKVNRELLSDDILDPTIIYEMHSELETILEENATPNVEKCLNMIRINKISAIDLDVYNQMRKNWTKINVVFDAINNTENRQVNWRKNEIIIYKIVTTKVREIQNDIRHIFQSVSDKSFVDLALLNKWNIPKTLQDFRVILTEMVHRCVLLEFLDVSIKKLNDILGVLIDTYRRIDSYVEKAKFVAYYSNKVLNETFDATIKHSIDDITDLNLVIQSNRVLEQFEIALHTWKQYQFPFAYNSNPMLKLFADINFKDVETLIESTANKIDYLRTQAEHAETFVGEYDDKIFENNVFGALNTNFTRSFYKWNGLKTDKDISKLLHGEEVIIISEITEGSQQSALKFKEIELQFEIMNRSLKSEFESELENFAMTMTMVGNNYYRCGLRTYFISVDNNIEIGYNFKRNSFPTEINKVYRLIAAKGYFFSPYNMWKIKLTRLSNAPADDFQKLKIFSNEGIELKLIGRGQYLKDQATYIYEICNDRLNDFYNFDNSTSTANKMKTLSYTYSL